MNPPVCVQFGVKGYGQLVPVSYADDISVHLCRNFHILPGGFDIGSADERHRDMLHAAEILHGMKTAELSAVGVSSDRDRQRLKIGPFIVAAGGTYPVLSIVFPERYFRRRAG